MANHNFDVDIAVKYGVNAAILLNNIHFWIQKNMANEANFYDGDYWTYNSVKAFAILFPYLSERQIQTALDKLINDDVLKTGCYNKDPRDRTSWYALTDKGWDIVDNCRMHTQKMSNANSENVKCIYDKCEMHSHKTGSPLPDNKLTDNKLTDRKPHISGNTNNNDACAREDLNPYRDIDYRPNKDTVQRYASDNLSVLSIRAMEEINDYIDQLGEDIVRHAIDNALDNGVRAWAYVHQILEHYSDANVKSVGEAKELDQQWRESKQGGKERGGKGADNRKREDKDSTRINKLNQPEKYGGGIIL